MSLQDPFAMHKQNVWLERARSSALPAWQRVACLAFGTHGVNGHANLAPGEIADLLGTDTRTGEIRPVPRQTVHRAIRTAVARGWLAQGSTTRCLVIPSHAIGGGNVR